MKIRFLEIFIHLIPLGLIGAGVHLWLGAAGALIAVGLLVWIDFTIEGLRR